MRTPLWRWTSVGMGVLLAAWLPAAAQGRGRGGAAPAADRFMYEPAETDPPPVVTHHSITVNGKTLSYTATVGKMPVPDEVVLIASPFRAFARSSASWMFPLPSTIAK